jgi:hypothetical protein
MLTPLASGTRGIILGYSSGESGMSPFACRFVCFAPLNRRFSLEYIVGARNSESKTNSGEKKELTQEDNPFPLCRSVGIHLQEKEAEGDFQLPRLLFTSQTRPVRLLPPLSMDHKGKKETYGEGLTHGCPFRAYDTNDTNPCRRKGNPPDAL